MHGAVVHRRRGNEAMWAACCTIIGRESGSARKLKSWPRDRARYSGGPRPDANRSAGGGEPRERSASIILGGPGPAPAACAARSRRAAQASCKQLAAGCELPNGDAYACELAAATRGWHDHDGPCGHARAIPPPPSALGRGAATSATHPVRCLRWSALSKRAFRSSSPSCCDCDCVSTPEVGCSAASRPPPNILIWSRAPAVTRRIELISIAEMCGIATFVAVSSSVCKPRCTLARRMSSMSATKLRIRLASGRSSLAMLSSSFEISI
mmetsp:Transcript_23820/g.72900  ORF Transcript_23820/g.72900 Transcript_23820/m.72900 type:complete len:268 (+) Transcript_23820:166-969(+)